MTATDAVPNRPHGARNTLSRILAELVRLPDWWHSKLPPLLAVAYLGLAGPPAVPPGRGFVLLLLFLASAIATAAWGHLLNDVADIEPDRRAGRPTRIGRLPRSVARLLLALLLAAAVAPWPFLPASPFARGAFAFELLLLAIYALPPLRLKERGAAGLVVDALYGHALPMAIVVGLFAPGAGSAAAATGRWASYGATTVAMALVLWKLAQGLCGALASQIADRRNDRRSGTTTWVATPERPRALVARRILLRLLFPAQLALFVAALAALAPRWPLLPVAYLLFLAARLVRIHGVWKRTTAFYRRGYPGYALLNDFHERWLPLFALAGLVASDRAWLPLAAAHLLLFRSGVGDLLRALFPRAA
ncbi:MAG: UbiA family prenyltransferase [Thermoanaerobaculia bacterium]